MRKLFASLGSVMSICLLAGISACDKSPSWQKANFVEREIKRAPDDVELPSSLWDKIRTEGLAPEKGAEKPTPENQAKPPATEFAPLKMYLVEKNKGILGGKNHALEFPSGGGEIDLADFITPLRGSFYVVFEFMPEIDSPTRRVFFLSNAQKRKIGDTEVGAGCETYFDITSSVAKAAKGDGFLVNTTDQRHVSALAGTYFFAVEREKKIQLASLVIRDSNHRDLLCRK